MTHRRIQTFARKHEPALTLAYHAALPVALTPELLHLLRLNFAPQLDYLDEATVLLNLCQAIGEGLYEMESAVRAELLQTLVTTHGADRLQEVAALLWQYSEQAHSWANYERLKRAQQLTVLSMFEPHEALNWLAQAETLPSASDQRAWFIAMREELSSYEIITRKKPIRDIKSLTPKQKKQFTTLLLACPSMQDRAQRDIVVGDLPFDYKIRINRHHADYFDITNIVNVCMEYSNGLNDLIEVLHFYEGDSLAMRDILQFCDELASQQSDIPEPPPIAKNYTEFIGRKLELNRILPLLHPNQPRAMVAIVGLGGLGKTALAQEVVNQAKANFEHVVWISAKIEHFMSEGITTSGTNTFTLTELCAEIGRQCDRVDIAKMLPEQQRYATEYLLSQYPTLIVLDNWDTIQPDRERLLQEFWPLLGKSKLLLTSRHQPLFEVVTSFKLEGLPQGDGLAFIQAEAKQRQVTTVSQARQGTQLQIWEATGGLPLAMKLVIGQASRKPLDMVLAQLQQAKFQGADYAFYRFLFWDTWQLLDTEAQFVLVDMATFPPNVGAKRADVEAISQSTSDLFWQAMDSLMLFSLVERRGEYFYLNPLTHYFVESDIVQAWQPA